MNKLIAQLGLILLIVFLCLYAMLDWRDKQFDAAKADTRRLIADANEPNDAWLGEHAYITTDPNDPNGYYIDSVEMAELTIDVHEEAEFVSFDYDDGVFVCDSTLEKFLKILPDYLYWKCYNEEPNGPVAIKWAEPNEPTGYNIALGDCAGYDWTDESYQFAFTVGEIEYSTTMTHDEWRNVYNVVNRAMQNKRSLGESK